LENAPDAITLRIFNRHVPLLFDMSTRYLEWVYDLSRQGRSIRFSFGIGNVKHKHHRTFGLENDDGPRTRPNMTRVLTKPSMRRGDERGTRHLNVDKHRIGGGIEAKTSNEGKQRMKTRARLVLLGEGEELIESLLCLFSCVVDFGTHCQPDWE
jgi:hypothetical protein